MDAGADFVDKIATLESEKLIPLVIAGRTFIQHSGDVMDAEALRWRPDAHVLQLETLTGLLDYAQQQSKENAKLASLLVSTPQIVVLLAERRDDLHTPSYAAASIKPHFPFEKRLGQTDAVIALQTECLDSDSRDALIALVSRLETRDEFEQQDDGVSTRVTIRKTAGTSAVVKVEPFHELRVRLTFAEIEQPTRRILLRMQKSGEVVGITFHEADGRGWELDVKRQIKAFLEQGLKDRELVLPVLA